MAALAKMRGQVPEAEFPIDEESDEESVQGRDHRGLGGREHAAQDPAENDERHEQGPDGPEKSPPDLAEAHEGFLFVSRALGQEITGHHQPAADQEAGDETAHEHAADGNAAHDAENDHGNGRRNNDPDGPAGGLNGRGKTPFGDSLSGSWPEWRRRPRRPYPPRPRRKCRRKTWPPPPRPWPIRRKRNQPGRGQNQRVVGDAAGFHQFAGQHEKGNGHQGKGIGPGEQTLRGQGQGQAGAELKGGHGSHAQGKGDGHAQDKANDEAYEQDGGHIRTSMSRGRPMAAARETRRELISMKMPPTGTAR